MVDSIEKSLNLFLLVACFLGCGIFRHDLDHSRLRLSIFYIMTVWSVYACVFYYTVTFFVNIITGFLIIFTVMTNFFVIIISIIITVRDNKKFHMCIRNLSFVDDTLEQLGIPKEYFKMRNSIKRILIVCFMTICITYAIDVQWAIGKYQDMRALIIPVVLLYPFHLNTFLDIIFIFLLRYIGTRLNKINDYIGQLSEIKEYRLRRTWRKPLLSRYYIRSAENREHILWTAMHLHLELCRIARNINGIYGMRITLQMLCCFVTLTSICYYQYYAMLCFKHIYKNNIPFIERIIIVHRSIWCGIFITRLVLLNYICESVVAKAEKTKDMIYKLTNLVCFNQIREDICQFVFQLSLQPLKFSGMGLFYFGYNFIREFIVGMISIMIFMVQIDSSPLSRILISRTSNETCYV